MCHWRTQHGWSLIHIRPRHFALEDYKVCIFRYIQKTYLHSRPRFPLFLSSAITSLKTQADRYNTIPTRLIPNTTISLTDSHLDILKH